MSFRFLMIASLCALIGAPASAYAASLRDIETVGTLNDNNGAIDSNVWSGLSRQQALMIVHSLPSQYASPVYYSLARRLLLSDAPSLPADAPAPKGQQPNDPDRPDMLIGRLDKLLEMGALRDAEDLYDAAVDGIPADFNLVFRNLEILMLRGQLSAACLDMQAMQSVHGNDARWVEMNALCRIQFAGSAERERLLNQTKFDAFPILGNYLRGKGPSSLRTLSSAQLAFAVATNYVNDATVRQLTAKASTLPPLLLSVLYQLDTNEAMPEKACLAIESAKRGIIGTRELITLYEKPHYNSDLMLSNVNVPPSMAGIHPCMMPSVLYQRIASNKDQPGRDATIRVALSMGKDLPDAAFWPMALYFEDFNVHAAANRSYVWRAASVLAYEKDGLPNNWYSGWGVQDGKGVASFWPILALMSGKGTAEEFDIWKQQWPGESRRVKDVDMVVPSILNWPLPGFSPETSKKAKNKVEDYENLSSLTFSRTYSKPSTGLTQRLADVIKNNQTGQSVALLLIGYGAIPPDQVFPHEMALVIDGMGKAGLGVSAHRFGLEVLP